MRRSISLLLLALFLCQASGCFSWHQVPMTAPALGAMEPNSQYRITLANGHSVDLHGVHVVGDSLVGTADSVTAADTSPSRISIPLGSVRLIAEHRFDAISTVALVGGLIAGTALIASALKQSPPPPPPSNPLCPSGQQTCALSCPLIYSWDGTSWWLDSGTFGGAITPALARTDLDNLLYVRRLAGLLQFRMTDEENETEHVDDFAVLAVDHPAGTDVAPDARANEAYHVLDAIESPIAAHDLTGRDVLADVRANDARSWASARTIRDPDDPAALREGLEVAFDRPPGTDSLALVVDARNTPWAAGLMGEMVQAFGRLTHTWYDRTTTAAASAPIAQTQHTEAYLQVSVFDGVAWRPRGEIWEAGPEVAKRQVLPLDLRGIPGNTIRVRLESAPFLWRIDRVALGTVLPSTEPVRAHVLPTVVVRAPRDSAALAHLRARDGRYLDMERGDTVAIMVRDTLAPPAPGMVRSYLARTGGWYRIHGDDEAAPDRAILAALASTPHAATKISIAQWDQVLTARRGEAHHGSPR